MSTRTLHTVLVICGLECRVEVEYKITSFGSPASWEEPGDPVEAEILSIRDTDTGRDWYPYAERTHVNAAAIKIVAYSKGYELDPMRCAVLGSHNPWSQAPWSQGPQGKAFYHYRTELKVQGTTVLDTLYEELYGDADNFVYDDPYEGYDG